MTDSALARLEESLARVIELLKKVQAENSELRTVIQQHKDDLEELKKENCVRGEIIEKLESDRLEIRSRVEKIIAKIGTLEKAVGEASSRME